MKDFVISHYDVFKALHLIAVISWMAGLLYLPRLFVYHADAEKGSELSETFKIMERRLLRLIMNPALVAVWLLGGTMLWANSGLLEQPWMHAKLTLIAVMTGFHHALARWRKAFVQDKNSHSARFYRLTNEVPTLLMVAIVVLAIVKPF